jgi:excisionase family DNA binding protein
MQQAAVDARAGSEVDLDKLLLRLEEAAEVLSISRSKLFELTRDGVLRTVKIHGSTRIPASELQRYVDDLVSEQFAPRATPPSRSRPGGTKGQPAAKLVDFEDRLDPS